MEMLFRNSCEDLPVKLAGGKTTVCRASSCNTKRRKNLSYFTLRAPGRKCRRDNAVEGGLRALLDNSVVFPAVVGRRDARSSSHRLKYTVPGVVQPAGAHEGAATGISTMTLERK